ncbi:MAG: family 43 glycosylhydrolase [Clostridiales bacterium]|nr:family 43 glycosylhydrolase [Clostridiales bacterium]
MKTPAYNPYLPFWETVPDGEPHVFDGRIYIFGSHDRRGGTSYCEEDYVGWSAPVDDPGAWRYEGVIYRKEQDPFNGAPYEGKLPDFDDAFAGERLHCLYAPDVAKGPDGRYYLYYALDFVNVISVAVCDTPAGKYEFLDYVRKPDGTIPQIGRWFDPAILSEESGNYLYYGFCPQVRFPGMESLEIPGSMMVRLADDMHTMISEPKCVANGCDTAKGTAYEAHPFFEASSIRKFGDWYYFVYSSLQGHELCYGMAKTPEGPFEYKGVIVSNGDIGLEMPPRCARRISRPKGEDATRRGQVASPIPNRCAMGDAVEGTPYPVNYTGNNHGGLVQIQDKYYIFWHRHTHGTEFSRQGCADEVQILEDGTIPQIAITSCGLNDGPLPAKGYYETYIACHLTEADWSKVGHVISTGPEGGELVIPEERPYVTEEPLGGAEMEDTGANAVNAASSSNETTEQSAEAQRTAAGDNKGLKPYIYNLRKGAVAGFKSFAFDGTEREITLELRGSCGNDSSVRDGRCGGSMEVRLDAPDGTVIARVAMDTADTGKDGKTGAWKKINVPLAATDGVHALYFVVTDGVLDFASFEIR